MRSLLMTRLASRFGAANLIRRDRPLTREELFRVVPSVFSEDKHESRSERYTYIPTISLLDSLQREGFQPFFACQTRVRDPGRREHTKHMLRLRREGQITGKQVPEIILLNSHDGTSSYQMLPGLFRAVCQNGLVCGESFGEVRVPHKGDVVSQVIEGAYEVLGIFDRVAALEREEFRVLYLDNQNQLIAHETLFTGTINRTEVHPREVVKRALHFNAAAVILAHNHPSGETTPSQADKTLTQRLVQVLQLVDIRVPDHLIFGGRQIYSFAEHGLL
ncbi:RadC family protein [Enterobacter hormaechei]|uniref:RadC family protein n=2 Tax=Enterobacter cloacae complex TaxID=354276 RepID=UPI0034CEF637